MEAEARTTPPDGSLEAGLRDLRDAVELREAEHARRNGNRVLFSRGVLLFFLGIFAGLLILGRGFDTQVYKERLYARLQVGAPAVVHQLSRALTELAPVYEAEVTKSMPQFNQNVSSIIEAETGRAVAGVEPIDSGQLLPLTDKADAELASALLKQFGPELNNDQDKAIAVAHAIRAAQLKGGTRTLATKYGGPFKTLTEISDGLHSMGQPTADGFNSPEIVSALGVAAMDAMKAKLISGEIGFGEHKATRKSDKQGEK